MKLQHGWAFPDADEFMVGQLQADGSYQGGNLAKALEFVTDWSLAIDGGAHVGTWSHRLRARFAQVIAVEPSPDTFEALAANAVTFGWTNVDLRHVAIGAAKGSVAMVLDGRGAEMKNTGARFVQPGREIPLVTIDSWKLPSVGFLKLDIEGSEVAALMGARQTLLRCKPVVLFENKFLWRRFGYGREAPQQLLRSLGYRHVASVSCDEIWAVPR